LEESPRLGVGDLQNDQGFPKTQASLEEYRYYLILSKDLGRADTDKLSLNPDEILMSGRF
jgi:hypothetical protein